MAADPPAGELAPFFDRLDLLLDLLFDFLDFLDPPSDLPFDLSFDRPFDLPFDRPFDLRFDLLEPVLSLPWNSKLAQGTPCSLQRSNPHFAEMSRYGMRE